MGTVELKVIAVLGSGTCGRVLLVEDPSSTRRYAAKLFGSTAPQEGAGLRTTVTPRQSVDRMAAVETARAIQVALGRHPHVATLADVRFVGGEPVLLFEVAAQTLGDLLYSGAAGEVRLPVPVFLALRVALQVSAAMRWYEDAAEGKATHNDLKPQNIFLDDGYHALVGDWGLMRIPGVPGQRGFTRNYASPSVLLGQPPTPRDDIFSLGRILGECLTGLRPFDGVSASRQELALMVPVGTRELRPGLPPFVLDLVEKWSAWDTCPTSWSQAYEALVFLFKRYLEPVSVEAVPGTFDPDADVERVLGLVQKMDAVGARQLVDQFFQALCYSPLFGTRQAQTAFADWQRSGRDGGPGSEWRANIAAKIEAGEHVSAVKPSTAPPPAADDQQREPQTIYDEVVDQPMSVQPWMKLVDAEVEHDAARAFILAETITAARSREVAKALLEREQAAGRDLTSFLDKRGHGPVAAWLRALGQEPDQGSVPPTE